MTSGIYLIRNTISGLHYVGQSSNIEQRFHQHRSNLRRYADKIKNGIIPKKRINIILSRSWVKHGEQSFDFRIIDICPIDLLTIRESMWLYFYRYLCLFRMANSEGPNDNPMRGQIHRHESIEKMRVFQRGRPKTKEHARKIGESQLGKVISEATKAKLRALRLGKPNFAMRGSNNPSCAPEARLRLSKHNPCNNPEIRRKIGLKNSKPIIDRITGDTWPSASACAKQLGVSVAAVSYNALGINKSCKGRHLAYI